MTARSPLNAGAELFPEALAPQPSPAMAQWMRAKQRAGDALLFFRIGDFYELFYDDARTASRVLGIALTSRAKERGGEPIPMAGVPVRSVSGYLRRLVHAGHTVAIGEQLQDPKQAKGVIERDVVRLVTAGTLTEDELLEGGRANFLAAVAPNGDRAGLAWCDLSTGGFFACEVPRAAVEDELARLAPSELLAPERVADESWLADATSAVRTARSDASFSPASARRRLCEAFGVATLEGFGMRDESLGVAAAGAVLDYLRDTQKAALAHLRRIEPWEPSAHVVLDRATRDALELTETMRGGERAATLFGVADRTRTPMGGRRLREWLLSPLRDVVAIRRRHDAVSQLHDDAAVRASLRATLGEIADLERILGRVGCERGSPADLGHLRRSLLAVPPLRASLEGWLRSREGWGGAGADLEALAGALDPCEEISAKLARTLVDAPPLVANEGGMVRPGVNAELDELKTIGHDAKGWLAKLEARESARTGIPNLKAGYHRVHGYFLEITNVHGTKVPADYARIQTLKDRERYTTAELRELEGKVRNAGERSVEIERELFEALRREVGRAAPKILATARAVADLDAIASLAEAAAEHRWVRPEVDDSLALEVEQGRHPVVERFAAEPFVPNDLQLGEDARLIVLTGPNMAGKSTYLRQSALLVVLAQAGSFVPARRARIGAVDRISTRVGSSDDLARGRSTFLVEMVETAAILHHATERSLVVLDEVGRGTSTFDGLAIAWAVAEHLAEKVRARTIFATHYHELNELAARQRAVRNYRVDVKEWGERVVFLRQVVEGGADRSYGIHVARLAGVPGDVVARARDVLRAIEAEAVALAPRIRAAAAGEDAPAPASFDGKPSRADAIVRELAALDPDRLTPIEALLRLRELRDRAFTL
ncbi:MAG TPA: DNA mismatch repair protein MutS [Planctomycetota bacterium]|nr:DNA mismatch repair protein MutS [Planctomycetota bacterium]